MTGTLSLKEISIQQSGMDWNVFYQPVSFLIFLICAFAELNRTPFDLAECESELIGGYHTEYSSMKMGFYLFAEYANMFISSAILSVLFLPTIRPVFVSLKNSAFNDGVIYPKLPL
jgi:NADH-quinone oxidoreductase subunit H